MTKAKSETAAPTTKARTAAKKSAGKEPVMYVGPTVNGIGIQNRVYTEIRDTYRSCSRKRRNLRTCSSRSGSTGSLPDAPGAERLHLQRIYESAGFQERRKITDETWSLYLRGGDSPHRPDYERLFHPGRDRHSAGPHG